MPGVLPSSRAGRSPPSSPRPARARRRPPDEAGRRLSGTAGSIGAQVRRGRLRALEVRPGRHDHHVLRARFASWEWGSEVPPSPLPTTPPGAFVESILAAAAQLDNDMRADRVIAGMKAATARWAVDISRRLRLLQRPGCDGTAVLVPDPERAALVRQAFRMAAAGPAVDEIIAADESLRAEDAGGEGSYGPGMGEVAPQADLQGDHGRGRVATRRAHPSSPL